MNDVAGTFAGGASPGCCGCCGGCCCRPGANGAGTMADVTAATTAGAAASMNMRAKAEVAVSGAGCVVAAVAAGARGGDAPAPSAVSNQFPVGWAGACGESWK